MKKISSCFFVCVVAMAAVSCTNQEYKKTKSGLLYKIISDKKGEVAKKGQFLKVNVVQKLRDSVLYSSYASMPVYLPVDSPRPVYSPIEIFSMLRKGDSAVVVELADTLQRKFGGQLPPFIKKKDKLVIAFKVIDVFASEEALMADKTQESTKEHDKETSAVQAYLTKNNINAQKTAKGTFVVVKDAGNGPAVDSGKKVSVLYSGKLFPSGKQFESNMDAGGKPYDLVIGGHGAIEGWDDGLRLFKKGGKGTLYIPAYLAYDQRPGPGNTPFENLIFDIEVVDVTDAPAKPAGPAMLPKGMPQMPQQRPQPQPHK